MIWWKSIVIGIVKISLLARIRATEESDTAIADLMTGCCIGIDIRQFLSFAMAQAMGLSVFLIFCELYFDFEEKYEQLILYKDVAMLKRFAVLILCFSLLSTPVQAAENEKLVALTFDDGPSGKYTRRLLEGLEERGAKATFLLCGYRMEQYPDLTEQIFQEGHEIGLHGYSHRSMQDMCRRDVIQEIQKAMALVPEGCEVTFLRSPGGLSGKCVQDAAADNGLAVLTWSVDPQDWATDNADVIEKRVISQVRDGDVILLHDMSDSSVEAALEIIDELQEQGFRFVTVSELAQARDITPVPGTTYTRFYKTDSQERK